MKILTCPPEYFQVDYKINPWMLIGQADQSLAMQQWQRLIETIEDCGARVETVAPVAGLPDMVFTANAGLFIGNAILLSQFRHPERQGERAYYQQWFIDAGIELIPAQDEKAYFEGAGDALYCGDTLFAAYGFRSDKNFYVQLSALGVGDVCLCELIDPHFYHIDTCFCPLDKETAIWWPGAFTPESQQVMQDRKNLIAVPKADANRFACNAVVIGQQVILPVGCATTKKMLIDLGYQVHECDMSEFLKAGGACKCLTLTLPE